MSIDLINMIFQNGERLGFDAHETAVLVRLASISRKKKRDFPALTDLSRDTRLSQRTIQRSLQSLVKKNFLVKVSPFHPWGFPNIYKINVDAFCSTGKENVA